MAGTERKDPSADHTILTGTENLQLVGAPYEADMIGVSRERFRQTVSYIPYMRSRFTNIDVIYRLGWMDEFIERMFGKGG